MSYQATVFNVLIASPGDVGIERDLAREVVYEWNASHSRSRKIVLQPIGWETHSHPTMGDRAQGVLNEQILKDADLLVAIFWSRIGTPTGEAAGGSVEELQRHMAENKPAMVYFSDVNAPLERGATPDYQALVSFRDTWCRPRGLIENYKSHDEFKEKFRRQLATKVNDDSYFAPVERAPAPEAHNPSFLEIANRLKHGESLDYIATVPDLSPEAKTLLIEGAKDKNGYIICRDAGRGWQVTTNGKEFVEVGAPRSRARWQATIQELASSQLIQEQKARGLFQLTNEGYEAADRLSN